jgi:hypothetical protein
MKAVGLEPTTYGFFDWRGNHGAAPSTLSMSIPSVTVGCQRKIRGFCVFLGLPSK